MQPSNSNRLALEKSPYLLQHAHNPVDWYPWGEEAFAKAQRENKPVILSIGYSTCHWCHVMEEESFENPKVAELMNGHFVSIKVDREERPDLDTIYMSYVMATTGGGGWPMTVFLTPDKKPFFGGTYFPPEDKFGMTGFKSLLLSISDAWKNRHEELVNSAESAVSYLRSQQLGGGSLELTEEALKDCFENYGQRFDSEWGGFGSAPKFPMSHSLSFLLRVWNRSGDAEALQMAEKTLNAMAEGGLHDQVGGGFHRYSTDRRWFLPHFEKMLYDQALIARAYLEAAQATRDKKYANTARGILDYVLEEMTSAEGGFFSAQDADSPDPSDLSKKKEGAFYVWKKSEIEILLGKKQADIFSFYFGVREEGNVEQDPHHEFVGQNVLFQAHSLEETAAQFKVSVSETEEEIGRAKAILKKARSGRPPLHLDDKILTDWNGLMISSFAFASRVLNEPCYAKAATRAAEFIAQKLKGKDGRLLHRYRDGQAALMANLDDYAFTIYAYLELYQATFDERWLKEARELADQMIEFFWDEDKKGFFLTAKDAEVLITRPKQDYDGALPSGNSMAALDLLWLNRMTGEERFENYAQETLKAFSELIASHPSGFTQMLIALDFALGPSFEIVIASDGARSSLEEFAAQINAPFLPNKVVLLRRPGKEGQLLEKLAPFLKDQLPVNGKTAVYVCRNHACQFPVTEPKELVQLFLKDKV